MGQDKLEFRKGEMVKYLDPESTCIERLLEDGWTRFSLPKDNDVDLTKEKPKKGRKKKVIEDGDNS